MATDGTGLSVLEIEDERLGFKLQNLKKVIHVIMEFSTEHQRNDLPDVLVIDEKNPEDQHQYQNITAKILLIEVLECAGR